MPAVAIADTVECLPEKLELLVLAGRAGVDYLRVRKEHLHDGKYPRADKIVFLSPPFAPDALPQSLVIEGSVNVVYGEFTARLTEKLQKVPLWIHIVKGGELYIPNWVRFMEVDR